MEILDEKVEICGFKCVNCPYTDCIIDDSGRVPDNLPIAEKLNLIKKHYEENHDKYMSKKYKGLTYDEKKKLEADKKEALRLKRLEYSKKYNAVRRRGARRHSATTNYEYVVSSDILELTSIILSLKDKDETSLLEWLDRNLIDGGLNND